MQCESAQGLIEAHLDDELDANRKAEIEAHLADCDACVRWHRQLFELRDAIRSLPHYTASARLRQRVETNLRGSPGPALSWKTAAIAAVVLLAVSLAWNIELVRSQHGDADLIAREIVSDHVRSLIGTHLLDVTSSDRHTVKPWFSGKLDFSPDVRDFAAQGFPLTGGRVEYVDRKPAAALVFNRRGHVINVFTWPTSAAAASPAVLNENGFNITRWSKGGMNYWVISDLNQGELDQFVRLYAQ